MSNTSSMAVQHRPERRQAIWPWVLMPLAALALFLTLRTVRHSGPIGQSAAPTSNAVSAAPAQ